MMKRFLGAAIALALSASPAVADRYSTAETAYLLGQFTKSQRLLLPLARKGDKRAQYLLGRQYQLGQGVKKDLVQSYVWYARAAKNGHVEAGLFKHMLISKWKMNKAEVTRAEAILAGKSPTTVASIKPTTPTASKSPGGAQAGKPPAPRKEEDFGPIGPDPRGPGEAKRDDAKRAPPKDGDPARTKKGSTPPPGDKPYAPKATAKADPKPPAIKAKPKPADTKSEEIARQERLRRKREAERRARAEAVRRQQEAERREVETRRRAQALNRADEMDPGDDVYRGEGMDRGDDHHVPEAYDPPTTERWVPAPPTVPYAFQRYYPRYYWQNIWRYRVPPARVYAPPRWNRHGQYRGRYVAPNRRAWQNRNVRRWQRQQQRAWRRYQRRRNWNRY